MKFIYTVVALLLCAISAIIELVKEECMEVKEKRIYFLIETSCLILALYCLIIILIIP